MAQIISFHKTKHTLFSGFSDGIRAPFTALSFITKKKGYFKFLIIPFFINILLLSAIVYFSFTTIYPYIQNQLPVGSEWYVQILRSIVGTLLFFITLVIATFLYSISGMLINLFFLDPLSVKVERELLTSADDELTFKQLLADLITTATNILKMIFICLGFNVAILILNLIPVAGSLLYTVFSFLSIIFFFGAPFIELPLDRRTVIFSSKFRVLWKYRYSVMGIGFSFMILSMIPILGFLSHSLGSIAGTVIFCEKVYPEVEFKQR